METDQRIETEGSDIYKNQYQRLNRGITVPKTGKANIDENELKMRFVRSSLELDHNVRKGTYPVFGYPLFCFSPIGIENKRNSIDQFWKLMYKSTMNR